MRAIRSAQPRSFKRIAIVLGLAYLLTLHYWIYSNGYSAARDEARCFSDSLFLHACGVLGVGYCPLHKSEVLHEGVARPAELPAATRLIYRRPLIDYCGFFMSQLPKLDELPFPGVLYPDTLPSTVDAPAMTMKICDECRSTAFIYLEPHYGMYRGRDSVWRYPDYSLLPPPPSSPPRRS